MKSRLGIFALILVALFFGIVTEANACGSHGSCGSCYGGGAMMGGGFAYGQSYGGAWSPGAYNYGYGRYPLVGFRTPLRPWGGITPVRQFLFGRGRIRRMNRRAFLFGGRRCGGRCF